MLPPIQELIEKGFGRSMTVGDFSTGIVGGGNGTVIDLDQPEFAIGVPNGYFCMPIRVEINAQPGVTTADNDEAEILLVVDSRSAWVTDPTPTGAAVTHTPEQPVNMRTDLGRGSGLNCGSAFVVDMVTMNPVGTEADPVTDMELGRAVQTANFGDATGISEPQLHLLYEPARPPILVGTATLLGYWGGTIATVGGFASIQWIEGPVSMLEAV